MTGKTTVIEKPPVYIGSPWIEVLQIFAVGLAAGAVVKLLSFITKQYFIVPVFCRTTDNFGVCVQGDQIALGIATVITALLAVVALARLNVFRPLLVVVATAATLWGLGGYLQGVNQYANWGEQTLWLMVLYGLSYVAFSWLLRVRNFAISLVATIVVIIGLRFMLIS